MFETIEQNVSDLPVKSYGLKDPFLWLYAVRKKYQHYKFHEVGARVKMAGTFYIMDEFGNLQN